MADNLDKNRPIVNRLVEITVLIKGWTVFVARIIEFSNYIGYSIRILVINILAGKKYVRNKPIRSYSSICDRTKHRDCKTCCNRG